MYFSPALLPPLHNLCSSLHVKGQVTHTHTQHSVRHWFCIDFNINLTADVLLTGFR